jgi:glycosyltransferase involved in cell wall biosynthesis
MGRRHKVTLVHQFALPSVSGVTVIVAELLRIIPAVAPQTCAASQSYQGFRRPDELITALEETHADSDCVVGINLHIEVGWDFTVALLSWCQRRAKPFYLHVHDYWPSHRNRVKVLTGQYDAGLLAITPHIAEALAADGFSADLLPVGVCVGDRPADLPAHAQTRRAIVGCVGRLVPRKRFTDVVRGFCHAGLGQAGGGVGRAADLYLRVPPSLVFTAEQDRARLAEIRAAAGACSDRDAIHIDPAPRLGTDYSGWSAYVCASEYEGVSMTPIESVLDGCPPLISDIPPHRALAEALFAGRADEFLFPVGDHRALADLLRDEVRTGWRRAELAQRRDEIHDRVSRDWSLRTTARALASLTGDGHRVVPSPFARDGADGVR